MPLHACCDKYIQYKENLFKCIHVHKILQLNRALNVCLVLRSLLLTHHPSPNAINIPARNFKIPLPGSKKVQNSISRLRRKKLFSFRNPLSEIHFTCISHVTATM